MESIIEILHREHCSCVIARGVAVTVCRRRGITDLYALLADSPETLRGAMIADKVVGKGAAALMVLGGITAVYADVISRPALHLLEYAGIPVSYGTVADNIINRAGTDICPVEKLCAEASTAGECLPLIQKFISEISNNTH